MAKIDILKRQILIIEVLRKHTATFEQINDYLLDKEIEEGYKLSISQRTFQRDRMEILSLFNIEIQFNKHRQVYEITEEESNPYLDRIIENFEMVAVLQKSNAIKDSIYLEKRKARGTEFFDRIIYATQNNFPVRFLHHSYWYGTHQSRKVVPKAIKESQNRFYLLAWDLDKKDWRNFGLDRISELKIGREKQSTPEIDIKEYYQHAFGMECYHDPVKIVLEFDNSQKDYIKSLPFHSSQKITTETEETFTLELFMHPTNDFIMEIMRHGPICEIKEPEELRDEILDRINRMVRRYGL